MTTTQTDALAELCAAERKTEVPSPQAVNAGWRRLQADLGPPGDGGEGGDASGSGGPAASGALPTAMKIAAALALATAVGVGIAISGAEVNEPVAVAEPEPAPAHEAMLPAPAPAPAPAPPRPALPAADPEPRPSAPAEPTDAQVSMHDAEAPAPTEPGAHASPRPATLPDAPGVGLAHEVAILREASAALAAGKPAVALRWTRRHALDHPDGSLTEERLATEAIARCALHDRRARATAERFLQRYPSSTHESRVRSACETMKAR